MHRRDTNRINKLLSERRWVYYIPADAYVEGYGFRVSIVFERESGHFPTGDWPCDPSKGHKMPWFWGQTYEEAEACAAAENEKRGISEKDACVIVLSSMGRGRKS